MLNTPENNPVRKAYETIYNGSRGRHGWDQCAILHAVRGAGDRWTEVSEGFNSIGKDVSNSWSLLADKNQSYSKVLESKKLLAETIADMMDDPPLRHLTGEPVRVIFDTGYSTDCDDPGALAVLHALADNGEAEILAKGASTSRPKAPGAIDVVNTYYGRPDIPVFATTIGPAHQSAFADELSDQFPHDTPSAPWLQIQQMDIAGSSPPSRTTVWCSSLSVTSGTWPNSSNPVRITTVASPAPNS